jgi:hypothetical protein
MTPREIVAKAWTITKTVPMLRRWGFAKSFLETMLNAKLLIYQTWFAYSYFILKEPIGFFTMEEVLLEHLPKWLAITIIVLLLLLVAIELIFPHFAKGAIIGLAAKEYKKEEVKGGLVLALYNFFPLFALHEMLVFSGTTTTITWASLSLRYGGAAAMLGVIIIGVLWLASHVLEFFWMFAEEAVVVRKVGVGKSIKRSFKLVVSYLGHVVFLLLLLFFISLRILANILMVVLIPGVVMGVGFLLTTFLPPAVSYGLGALLGMVIIFFASYFFAYLEVFRQTVWTITYIELSKQRELDVIEKPDDEDDDDDGH